jgi:hypothetical protein
MKQVTECVKSIMAFVDSYEFVMMVGSAKMKADFRDALPEACI